MIEDNQNNTNIETLDVSINPIETLDTNPSNFDNNGIIIEKKNKNSKLLIFIGLIVVLLIGLGVHYLLTINNPKTIFTKISNSFFESMETALIEAPEFLDKSYLYEGNVKINTNIEEYTFLNNETFNYALGLDIKNKKAEAEFGLLEGSNKLINVNANVKDNNVYVDLDELFEKVILFDDNTIKENTGMSINEIFTELEALYSEENIDDIKYIVTKFKEITNEVLEKVDYEKDNTKVDVNGKSVSANKMSLKFSKDNLQVIAKTYIDGILNDDKLIDKIVSLGEIEKSEFVEMLNSAKEQISSIEEPSGALRISIYTKGLLGNIVKVALEENSVDEAYFVNYKEYKLIAIDDMFIEINDTKLTIKEGEDVIANGTVNSFETNNINIDFVSVDNELFKGNVTYVNNNSNMNFKFNLEVSGDEKIAINLESNINNVSDTETETKIVVDLSYGNESIKVTNTTKMTVGANIANINANNTLNYNNMTEEDMNTITSNLEARLKGTKYGELMNINGESDFITDANNAIEAASQAVSFITIGSSSNYYTMENANTYCFTLQNLEDAGYLKGYDDYEGTITVTKVGNNYSYRIEMHNDEYYVRTKDVVYEDVIYTTKYMPSTIKTKCISMPNL